MAHPILSLSDATLSLKGNAGLVQILKDITLDVHRGETVGLVGPSGSGKSSLLMLMGGLEQATSGQVTALDHDLTTMSEDQLARLRRNHFGVVFQSFHLIPTMTALENVATPLELAGHRDAFARATEELAAVGLADRVDHYPSQLSGGEQQRVQLARVLCQLEASSKPDEEKFLFLDEPISNLDVRHQIKTLQIAKQYAGNGLGVVAVLHDLNLAARFADEVIVMCLGKCVADATPKQAFTEAMLERVFEVGFEVSADREDRIRISLCDIIDTPSAPSARF